MEEKIKCRDCKYYDNYIEVCRYYLDIHDKTHPDGTCKYADKKENK